MIRLTTLGLALAVALGALTTGVAEAQRPIPVSIESDPAGATVYMDAIDPSKRIGVTPLSNVRIPRGQHTLIFQKEMHEEARITVNVRRRREVFRATLNAQSTISVSGTNTAAQGAAVRIDGQPVGNVPHMETVAPGRHLVQVGREGYVTFAQWVQVAPAQAFQVPVSLEAEAPETGSLLVAGDTTGAAIYIDGEPRGSTPSVVEGIPAGEHVIKVQSSDPNMQVFEQRVRIIAGERVTLNPTLRPAPAAVGSIRVLVRPSGAAAVVSLDGEVLGEAPAGKEGITPGEHIVEVTADGYEDAQQPVNIESGSQRVVSVTLQRIAAAPGRIVVNANVAGATVMIDGEDKGAPPIVIEDASAGTHAIVVRAPGYQELRHTCSVGPGVNCELTADMNPVGAPVRVEANVTNAEFVVDGEVMGPVPWEGTVPTGSHRIEIRAEGYRPYTAVVTLQAQEPRLFNAGLVEEGQLTPEERAEREADQRRRHRQSVARSGAPLDPDVAVLDFSIGWPYLLELRMGIGILDWLDAGIGIRTMFRLTEFEGRVKAGIRPVKQVSLGILGRIGGGIGVGRNDPLTIDESGDPLDPGDRRPDAPQADGIVEQSTNSFFFSLEALFTLHFLRAGNFTLWGALDYHSDSWAWSGTDNNCRFAAGCVPDNMNPAGGDNDRARDPSDIMGNGVINGRQNMARFRLGGSLEFIIAQHWNMWLSFEGTFGGDRRIVGDLWGANRSDINAYTRLGFTYKFGYGEE